MIWVKGEYIIISVQNVLILSSVICGQATELTEFT